MHRLRNLLGKVHNTVPIHSMVGIGLSGTSLGIAYHNREYPQINAEASQKRADLELKSYKALEKIHKALQANPHVDSSHV